jgi:hypothetical protein
MRSNPVSRSIVGLFVVAVALSAPAVAWAQGSGRPIGIGGKVAWNSSRVRGEAATDEGFPIHFGTDYGYSLGGVLSFEAGANVTIQPEIMYSEKTITAHIRVDDFVANGMIDSDWLEIPILAKLHGQRTRGARPFAMVGATVSFLVNAEQTLTAQGVTEVENIEDELVSTDIGITLGAGVDFLQDWGVFTVDVRYTFGLRRLDDVDDVKQDTLALSGGFIF